MSPSFSFQNPELGLGFSLIGFSHPSPECISLGDFGFGGSDALDATHAFSTLGNDLAHFFDRMMGAAMVTVSDLGHGE